MSKARVAFTLIELILVVVIVVILASVGIAGYTKSREKAITREAMYNLKLIAAAQRVYRMEQGVYVNCSCSDASGCLNASSGCNALLKLSLNTNNWTYAVAGAPTAANITATGVAISGKSCTLNSGTDGSGFDSEPACSTATGE